MPGGGSHKELGSNELSVGEGKGVAHTALLSPGEGAEIVEWLWSRAGRGYRRRRRGTCSGELRDADSVRVRGQGSSILK
jgi:hypothetical protein